MDLPKTFDSKSAEERWFQQWIDLGYFKADPARPGKVFSVVIPPPNVTGQLHLGHALNVSLQDIIVRTRRMQGYNTLWLPGTDHAGIATQNAVEKDLAKEGKDRHKLGRDAFVARVWEWRETYGDRILNQLRRLGASCDWSRERFTLSPELSRVVLEAFAARVPVVAFVSGGIPEIVTHNKTGFLIEPPTAGALAAKLETLLDEPGELRDTAGRAHEAWKEKFTLERYQREVLEVIGLTQTRSATGRSI